MSQGDDDTYVTSEGKVLKESDMVMVFGIDDGARCI